MWLKATFPLNYWFVAVTCVEQSSRVSVKGTQAQAYERNISGCAQNAVLNMGKLKKIICFY